MDHSVFVQKYHTKSIQVKVDKNKAGFMFQDPFLMPFDVRKKQANLRLLVFSSFALSVALFFFVKWWIAVICLLAVLFILAPKAQKHAANTVLELALKNSTTYNEAIKQQVLTIEEKN